MNKLLETNNLSKQFKETKAVNNLNMTINKGDIYGFVGENGAGKSTVIKLISGILIPTSGSFNLNTKKELGKVSAIVENTAIHLGLTALDNLSFQNTMLGLNKSKDDLVSLLNLVCLENEINSKKKAKSFSLGMKQRLNLAIALLSDPVFILLDEPMNGLDPLGIKNMRDLIVKLNKEKDITFLISSHNLLELDRVASKYGFISKGVLLEEITHNKLHENIKPYIKLVVKDKLNNDALKYLNRYNFKVIEDNIIHLENDLDTAVLIKDLTSLNVEIISIEKIVKTVEDYYLNIIGGNLDV